LGRHHVAADGVEAGARSIMNVINQLLILDELSIALRPSGSVVCQVETLLFRQGAYCVAFTLRVQPVLGVVPGVTILCTITHFSNRAVRTLAALLRGVVVGVTFVDKKVVLVSLHVLELLVEATVSTFAAFIALLGVVASLNVVVHELSPSIDA